MQPQVAIFMSVWEWTLEEGWGLSTIDNTGYQNAETRFLDRCLDVEFVNSRQGGHSSNVSTGYSTTAVSDYVNITLAADVSVYNRAKARFTASAPEKL
eukprot:123564-Amphidinium_carterae.1